MFWWMAASTAVVRLTRATKHAPFAERSVRLRWLSSSPSGTGSMGPGLKTRESEKEGIVVLSPHEIIPFTKKSVTDHVFEKMEKWKDGIAMTCATTKRSYRYGELRDNIRRFSRSVVAPVSEGGVGLKRGDVIGIMMHNSPDFPIVFHGAIEAGIIVTTANPSFTAGEISRQMENSKANVLVTQSDVLQKAKEVMKDVSTVKNIILMDNLDTVGDKSGCLSYNALISSSWSGSSLESSTSIDLDSTAILPYSSGTEGLPKGVMLTHTNLASALHIVEHPNVITRITTDPKKQDTCFAVLPFYHIFGMNGLMNLNLRMGRHLVIMPKFEANSFIEAIKTYRPQLVYLVPPLLLFLAKHPGITEEDLSSIEQVICGAAPATKTIIDAFMERAGRYIDFREGYGLTETSGIATILPKWHGSKKGGSCGCLVPKTEARIIDSTGKGVGAFSKGELVLRGPQVMKGYLNNEDATRKILDADGWLHTGDIAYFDEEGYFFIVDRMKDLIKVKGSQVSPTELEEELHKCPGISDVAVIGVPDLKAGELPAAFVVKSKDEIGSKLKTEDVHSWMSSRVAHFKRLSGGVTFLDAIPKSPAGKVLRKELLKIAQKQKGST